MGEFGTEIYLTLCDTNDMTNLPDVTATKDQMSTLV